MRIVIVSIVLAAAFAAALVPLTAQAKERVTVEEINAAIVAKGGRYVVNRYFDIGPVDGPGYRLVESGDPAAVRMGVRMLQYTDAGASESLHSALGTAMMRAPQVVLPYVNTGPRLDAELICQPFISVDDPIAVQRAIVARVRRSLMRVHVKGLERQKQACLAVVK